jgi:hypothetical protein
LPDVSHRRHNGTVAAWHKAGVTVLKLEYGMVWNAMKGPWAKSANFQTMKECATQYFASEDHTCSLFRFSYPLIVKCRGKGRAPSTFGTEEHYKEVFNIVRDSPLWKNEGTGMKISRCYSWSQKQRAMQEYLGDFLIGLLVLGIAEGFFDRVNDFPFHSSALEKATLGATAPAAVPAAAGASSSSSSAAPAAASSSSALALAAPVVVGPEPPSRAPVAGKHDGTEAGVFNKKRALQLVLQALCRGQGRRIATAMRAIPEPVEEEHRKTQTISKTQTGRSDGNA